MNRTMVVGVVTALVALAACGDDEGAGAGGSGESGAGGGATASTTTGAGGGGGGPASTSVGAGAGPAGCERGVLEDDLVGQTAEGDPTPVVWIGPGADPETGELLPEEGAFVVSATYLALDAAPEAQQRFGEVMGPIMGELFANPALVAVQLGTSPSCGTARTFTVWRSLEGMMSFVAGDAHMAAVASVGEISRGGSVVTHWEVDTLEGLGWDDATARLADVDGPMY